MNDGWDEWIECPEGEYGPPVDHSEMVQVTLRSGMVGCAAAGSFNWKHLGALGDILRYRQQIKVKSTAPQPSDTINHPSHYTNGKVEAIDAIEAATTGLEGVEAVCTGNVLKYIWRWKLKNGIEDLKKARWYLDRLIAKVEGEEK